MTKKLHLPLLVFLSLFLSSPFCFGQNRIIDSLYSVLKSSKEDTSKVLTLNELVSKLSGRDDPDKLLKLIDESEKLATRLNFNKGLAVAVYNKAAVYLYIGKISEAEIYLKSAQSMAAGSKKLQANIFNAFGTVYNRQGNFGESLKFYTLALNANRDNTDSVGIGMSYNNIGNLYGQSGNYPEALKNFFASLKIKDKMGNKRGIASTRSAIGTVYQMQGDHESALKEFFLTIKLNEELGSKSGLALSYNNIGLVYSDQNKYDEALKYYTRSLRLMEEVKDPIGISAGYYNIGNLWLHKGDYSKAMDQYLFALKISEEAGDQEGIAGAYSSIGGCNILMKKNKEGKTWLQKAIKLGLEIRNLDLLKSAYSSLASADSALGNYKEAFSAYKSFISCRDSLSNEENTRKSVQLQAQYNFDKKEEVILIDQARKEAISKTESRKQQIIIYVVSGALFCIVLLSLITLRSLRLNKIKNKIILEQKDVVEKQKALVENQKTMVEEKQKEIIDSITYARRIQRSLLTSEKYIERCLKKYLYP